MLAGSTIVVCADQYVQDDAWPQAWFEAFPTASSRQLNNFTQSPYLDGRNLPPVGERLPPDPPIVTPLDPDGRYGGTARITRNEWLTFPNVETPLAISADMRTFLPNLALRWEVTEAGKHITFYLRRGVRWSDGHPFTAEDLAFSFNDLFLNKEFAPVSIRSIRGGRAVVVNPLTIRYEFPYPNPLFVNWLAQYGNFMLAPKHHFAQFHPDYAGKASVDAKMKEMGYLNWTIFLRALPREVVRESVDMPTLNAHKLISWSITRLVYERNPYYFKIDPQGRQLPYIDRIESAVVDEKEVIAAMASTGQLDFSAYELKTQDIPLLKLGERTGDIKVLIWNRLHTSDVVIQMNYNHADQRLANLYWQRKFRRALSIAIDRDEMNELIYFGRGTPGQVTAHPSSSYFEPEFRTAWTQYDPEQAKAWLADLDLHDSDGDGIREYPNGDPLTITLEYMDWETPKQINMQLVASYWRAIGVDLRLKIIDASLQQARGTAGEMQMTVWHADRTTDILFPLQPEWWLPRRAAWDISMWNDWARWYGTRGAMGKKPPPIIEELQALGDIMLETTDPAERIAAGKKVLASNAENVWNIGTVGLAPQPVVISKRLRGVPARGTWGWDNRWTMAYHPATWYFAD